jgi:hypothetical protein
LGSASVVIRLAHCTLSGRSRSGTAPLVGQRGFPLGTHNPGRLRWTPGPLLVSRQRLESLSKLPRTIGPPLQGFAGGSQALTAAGHGKQPLRMERSTKKVLMLVRLA